MPLSSKVPAVILSGGSEIVSVALVEELVAHGIPIILVALGRSSLLRGAVPGMRYREMAWPPPSAEVGATTLLRVLKEMGADTSQRWPVFATEDGGLRLLMEQRDTLGEYLAIGGAAALRLGGLDKAELFDGLFAAGIADYAAPTVILNEPSEIPGALAALGGDCILKPALKPLSMDMAGMPSKVLASNKYRTAASLVDAAASVWSLSERWILQTRLKTPIIGETVWWGVTGGPACSQPGILAVNKWKQPRVGGSGCWVCIAPKLGMELDMTTRDALRRIGHLGLVEVEYLVDRAGGWRLIELNSRPWLQIGLPFSAGVPLATAAYRVLLGEDPGQLPTPDTGCWANPERLVLAAFSGEYGRRWSALCTALAALRGATTTAIYGSPWRRVTMRWVGRVALTAARGMIRR